MFESIGLFKFSKVVRDKNIGYSYGFGFVDYFNLKDVVIVISQLNGYRIEYKVFKVVYFRKSDDEIKGFKFYF